MKLSTRSFRFTIFLASLFLLTLSIFYIIAAWNLQWSAGYLLIPAADDWMEAEMFSQYFLHGNWQKYLYYKINGHPQWLIKLISMLHYQLGWYSYKESIAITVLLHALIPAIYAFFLYKAKNISVTLKLLLLSFCCILFFDARWIGIFRIIQGHIWSYGYVFAYISLFITIQSQDKKNNSLALFVAGLFAFIACQLFAAAFGIWLALFYLAYINSFSKKKFIIIGSIFAISALIYYLLTEQSPHKIGVFLQVIHNFPNFIIYFISLCGDNVLSSQFPTSINLRLIIGLLVCATSLYFIFTTIKNKPQDLIIQFLTAAVFFSILVILFLASGRHKTQPFNYYMCALALHVPLFALIAIISYQKFKAGIYPFVMGLFITYLYFSNSFYSIWQNNGFVEGPSGGFDYERISLMLAHGVTPQSIKTYNFVSNLSAADILIKHKFGFMNWLALEYLNKKIDIEFNITKEKCNGGIKKSLFFEKLHPQMMEITGWAWDTIHDKAPQLILISDLKHKIIGVAAPERSQPFWQTNKKALWVSYIPYTFAKKFKIWLMIKENQVCQVNKL